MALLKEDNTFTHVIAIDFGTGASGYTFFLLVGMRSHLEILIKTAKLGYRFLVLVMVVMIKKHQLLSSSTTMATLSILAPTPYKNIRK